MLLGEAMYKRRSVRSYIEKDVEEDKIKSFWSTPCRGLPLAIQDPGNFMVKSPEISQSSQGVKAY